MEKKFYEKEDITKLIDQGNYKGRYFRVELLDENCYEAVDLVGRYPNLMIARKACDDYQNEEIDGHATFRFIEYMINEYGTPIITERSAIFY